MTSPWNINQNACQSAVCPWHCPREHRSPAMSFIALHFPSHCAVHAQWPPPPCDRPPWPLIDRGLCPCRTSHYHSRQEGGECEWPLTRRESSVQQCTNSSHTFWPKLCPEPAEFLRHISPLSAQEGGSGVEAASGLGCSLGRGRGPCQAEAGLHGREGAVKG